MSPEVSAKIQLWRSKVADGTITLEEMKEAVRIVRGDRRTAASASPTAKRTKAKAVVPDADDMLKEMGL